MLHPHPHPGIISYVLYKTWMTSRIAWRSMLPVTSSCLIISHIHLRRVLRWITAWFASVTWIPIFITTLDGRRLEMSTTWVWRKHQIHRCHSISQVGLLTHPPCLIWRITGRPITLVVRSYTHRTFHHHLCCWLCCWWPKCFFQPDTRVL